MRRLAVVACALGLLLALPVQAATAKVLGVAVSLEVRQGHNGVNNCTAAAYLQWQEQKGAEEWRLEYLWNGKLEKKNLKPPFTDEPHSIFGWAPPGGAHWYLASISGKSAGNPETPVDCTDLAVGKTNAFGGGTVYITVPDDPEEEEPEGEDSDDSDDGDSSDPDGKDKEIVPPEKPVAGPKCRGNTPTIYARPGTPTNGTARRDVILGTSGRDVIRGRGGNDLICGLPGNDKILGGAGRDVLMGQGGRDTLHGQGAKDTLLGGGGADRLFGQAAADRLFGQAGVDFLNGGPGRPDLCNGGQGRDRRRSPGCERRRQIP